MASIEHTMPTDVKPLDGSRQGVYRPGLQVSTYQTGYRSSRDWFEYNLRSYTWALNRFSASGTYLKQYQAWLDHVRMGGSVGWITEALSALSSEVVISPIGDGSRTSFVLPFFGAGAPTDLVILDNGAYTEDYTVHAKANILTDAQANAIGGTTGMVALGNCAISSAAYPTADGLTSFRITPAAAAASLGIATSAASRPVCIASQEYTAFAAFRGTGDVRVNLIFYDNVDAQTGSTEFDNGTMTESGWTIVTVTATSAGDAVKAHISGFRTTSSDSVFHVGCMGIIPGDLSKWFLPSEAPMVLELDAAPGDRERVLAHGTGTRMTRARVQAQRGSDWTLTSPGDAHGVRFSAFEEIES